MNFNLTILNLWIGLCRGIAGLPRDLRDLGYQDWAIERRFKNQDREDVHPELVVCSQRTAHTILLESKSGRNTEADQLRRYSRVSSDDLRERIQVPAAALVSHDVAILGKNEHTETLKIGLESGSYDFPLVVALSNGLGLVHNTFQVDELNALFDPHLPIDWKRVPMHFVPLDEASELWEVANVVIPKVVEHMLRRTPAIRVRDLGNEVCPTWQIMGRPGQETILERISAVLQEAAREEFANYFRWTGANQGTLVIQNNPLDVRSDRRSGAYRSLASLQQDFIGRLEAGQTSFI